ncbi:MAG: ABC transporter permease [Candidatus Bipolaricaulis sp.]|nr:ABC transporter permease [Candidatus Bipolaricaulis sp.]
MRERNFWRFVTVRVLSFLFTYGVLVYAFCALLDAQLVTQVGQTLYWDTSQIAQQMLGSGDISQEDYKDALQEMYRQARHERGFDLPLVVRIHARAMRILRFDFGRTATGVAILYRQDAPVLSVIGEFAAPTVVLFTGAFVIQMLLGVLVGVRNANHPGSFPDRATTFLATATMSVPPAAAAMFAVLLFVFAVPIAPSTPFLFHPPSVGHGIGPWILSLLSHLALPFLTVVALTVWGTAHIVRNLNLGVLQDDFISAARARGIPESRVLYRHGLRTSAPPIVTLAVTGLFASLWGSFLVEPIFQWQGIGSLFLVAIRSNDITMLLALLVLVTGATQLGHVVLDLIYGRLDPRIKVGQSQLRPVLGSRRLQRAAQDEVRRVRDRARLRLARKTEERS